MIEIIGEERQNYLASEYKYCPFCGSEIITQGKSLGIKGNLLDSLRKCNQCNEKWVEEYKLVGIYKFSPIE